MVAGSPCRIAAELISQLTFRQQMIHDVLCRGRATNIAQTDKQQLGGHDSWVNPAGYEPVLTTVLGMHQDNFVTP